MKNIARPIIINLLFIIVAVVLFRSVSYSINEDSTKDNKDLLVKTGNMQVVLNIPNEKYELLDVTKERITDIEGLKLKGYSFSIKNTGNMDVDYYEIRLVDQEGKVSTLPHKYLRFTINKDGGEYEDIKNLGDNDSILYFGHDLNVGDISKYNLKMWVDSNEINALEKELYGAIEITLYQKFDVYKNYVLYNSPDSTNVPIRTSIYNPISGTIPKRDGYKFTGWKDDTRVYKPGDTYDKDVGVTLTALWEKE